MALEPLIYDETTGLPKLPEGYAWKVQENEYADYTDDSESNALIVRVAKELTKGVSWWDGLMGHEAETFWTVYDHDYDDAYERSPNTAEGVKEAATKAYNQLRDAELQSAEMQKLVGLYPPKSIL